MRKVDYEEAMTRRAVRGLYDEALRPGPTCLICRSWKKPCRACSPEGPRDTGNPRKHTRPDLNALIRYEMRRLEDRNGRR